MTEQRRKALEQEVWIFEAVITTSAEQIIAIMLPHVPDSILEQIVDAMQCQDEDALEQMAEVAQGRLSYE